MMVAFGEDSFIVYNGVENPEIVNTLNKKNAKSKNCLLYTSRTKTSRIAITIRLPTKVFLLFL